MANAENNRVLGYAPPDAQLLESPWLQAGTHVFAAVMSIGMTTTFFDLYRRFGHPGFFATLLGLVIIFAVVGTAYKQLSRRWLWMGIVMFVIGWVDFWAWGSGIPNPSPDFAMLGGVVLIVAGVIRRRRERQWNPGALS